MVEKRLTPDKLRSFPGLEHHTDEEAEKIIDTLERFARIAYDSFMDMKNIGALDENGKIIEDHPELIRRREAFLGKPKEPKTNKK